MATVTTGTTAKAVSTMVATTAGSTSKKPTARRSVAGGMHRMHTFGFCCLLARVGGVTGMHKYRRHPTTTTHDVYVTAIYPHTVQVLGSKLQATDMRPAFI